MWEAISFAAGMIVLMLLYAILGHVFELPEIVMKYLAFPWRFVAESLTADLSPEQQATVEQFRPPEWV